MVIGCAASVNVLSAGIPNDIFLAAHCTSGNLWQSNQSCCRFMGRLHWSSLSSRNPVFSCGTLGHLLFSPHLCELHATTSISIMSKMKCYCPTSSTCPSRNHIRCRRSLWSNLDATASQLQGTKSTACFEIVNLSTYFIFLKQATATYHLAGPASWKPG